MSRVSKMQCGKNGKMSSSSAAKRSKPSRQQQQLAMRLKKSRRDERIGGREGKGDSEVVVQCRHMFKISAFVLFMLNMSCKCQKQTGTGMRMGSGNGLAEVERGRKSGRVRE